MTLPPLPEGYELHELPPDYMGPLFIEGQMREYAAAAVAAEREACANIADTYADNIGPIDMDTGASIAAAIRARGGKDE